MWNNTNPKVELQMVFASAEDPWAAALDWAKNIAQEKGIDPHKQPVAFVREIRRADTSLSLKAAAYLAEEVKKAHR